MSGLIDTLSSDLRHRPAIPLRGREPCVLEHGAGMEARVTHTRRKFDDSLEVGAAMRHVFHPSRTHADERDVFLETVVGVPSSRGSGSDAWCMRCYETSIPLIPRISLRRPSGISDNVSPSSVVLDH